MVHDWFVHKRSPIEDGVEIPLAPGDDWADGRMKIPRSVPEPAPAGSTRPPAYANSNSHWWDGSQIYGSDAVVAATLRTGQGGKLRLEATKLLPVDPETGVHLSGFTDNWWIGLAMLHTIFTQEHNHICDLLARDHPDWNDAQLHGTAKLDQLRPDGQDSHHGVDAGDRAAPDHRICDERRTGTGLPAPSCRRSSSFSMTTRSSAASLGPHAEHHAAPYSLTEEFVSVYRMHPLIPDQVLFRSLRDDAELETIELPDMAGRKTPAVANRIGMSDLFYSFGRAHPGAITLHNFPKHLQNLTRDDGEHLDLAAVDIFRDRERGVPRYNQFRRLMHKEPVRSFEELTNNPVWREQIRTVYGNDLEKVDLMTGLYAEPLPEGFGFSETAFRIFLLMATRRLKSDRFFTDDYRPEVYTQFGVDYVRDNGMLSVLKRHHPELAPALEGVTNAFKPWRSVAKPA